MMRIRILFKWHLQMFSEYWPSAAVGWTMGISGEICLAPFFPDVFPMAPDCLLALPPFRSKLSSAGSTSTWASSTFPSLPAFCFFATAGDFLFSTAVELEVDGVTGVEGAALDVWGEEEQRSLFLSCSLANSWRWSLTPTHLSREERRTIFSTEVFSSTWCHSKILEICACSWIHTHGW